MDPIETLTQENVRLQRTMHDLAALSTLPAEWTGCSLEDIAHSLANTLFEVLSLDLLFVRLPRLPDQETIEVIRSKHGSGVAYDLALKTALIPLLQSETVEPNKVVSDLFGPRPLRLAVTRWGANDDDGFLISGSIRPDYPTEHDKLLLGVGTNQTAIVVERRHAEEQLREREKQLRLVTDHAPVFLVHCDRETRFIFVNKPYAERFGLDVQSIVGKRIAEVIGESAYASFRQYVEKTLTGDSVEFEVEIPYKQIGKHVMRCACVPDFAPDGTVRGLVAVLTDVTQRERAAEALRDSEQRFAQFMQHLPGLAWIKDTHGRYVYVNDAAEIAFRAPRSELYGKSDFEIFSNETAAQFKHNDQLAMASLAGVQVVEALAQANGELRYSLVSKFPLLGADGQVALIGGMAIDITDRRRAEEEMRHNEERFRSLMEQAPFSIQIFAPSGRTIRVNRAWEELWSTTFEQIQGYNVLEDKQLEAKGILRYIRLGFAGQATRVPAIEYDPSETLPHLKHQADARRWLSAVIYPIKDASGELREVVLIHEDITARYRAEAELEDARARLDAALEAGAISTWTWDIPSNRMFADKNLARLFGVPPADASGALLDKYINAILPEDWPRVSAALSQSVESGNDYEADYRIRQTDGSICWVTARGRVERDAEGRPVRMPGVLVDITERKRLEDEVQVRLQQLAEADRRKEELLVSLQESEEKLRLLADTIPHLAWMAKPDGNIFWYNRRWYEYTGTSPGQMEGWGWQDVHDPQMLPTVLERWKRSIELGEQFEMVFPIKGCDGNFRSFLTRVNPLRDRDNQVVYWFGTHTDIEEQKRAQEALAESMQRFHQLADAMPQIVWTASPDGQIEYMNRQWYEFTGLPENLGNAGWSHILHSDEALAAAEKWQASVESGLTFEMELRLLDRRSKSYRWHLIRTVPAYDAHGKIIRWFGTSTDIHEQKHAEESSRYLAKASAALASVANYEDTLQKVANLAVPHFADLSAVDMDDGDGGLRRLALAHLSPDKLLLVHHMMQDYPSNLHAPFGALSVLRTGQPEIVSQIPDELLERSATDEHHLQLLRSLGLKSYISVPLIISGVPFGVLTFATAESGRTYTEADLALAVDLAHRAAVAIENNRLYQALRENDRRKDEFLATLAHELRNPLAPIRNSLQILKLPRVDAETARQTRDMMERQVHHLVRLVDDLLDVSRVMRGKIELRKEPVELSSIVARAVETVMPLIDVNGHELFVSVPDESLLLHADPVRLAQVVGNLLTNAAKYTEANGRIWLTARREGDHTLLSVRDNGIGIAAEMLPQVFELFVQADHTSTRAQGGLGIGLTLVKNLVEMHAGSVSVSSAGLGAGSEFVVRLPLMADQQKERIVENEVDKNRHEASSSGHRLLVVDDNKDAATSLAMLLRLSGHEVRVAHDGPAALDTAMEYRPAAIFLDLGMPGMDGYEVARILRSTPGMEKVVLAALTGWGQQEDRRRTAEAGFDHHLVKPPELSAVQSLLAALPK